MKNLAAVLSLFTFVSLGLSTSGIALGAEEPDAVRKATQEVFSKLEVQKHLPNEKSEPKHATRVRENDSWSEGPSPTDAAAPAAGAIQHLIFIVLMIAAVAIIVSLVASGFYEAWSARRASTASPALPLAQAGAARSAAPTEPNRLLARADELAADGRYSEAMHQVLLAALQVLGRGSGGRARDSLTSRELLRTVSLPREALQPLRELVATVERAWFGNYPSNQAEYTAARTNFETFAAAAATTISA